MKKYAIIMAGGPGERFWPLSRIKRPKYLWNIAGGQKSLLSLTFSRLSRIVGAKNTFVIINSKQARAVKKFCPEIPTRNVISEPCSRDTTAAVSLAAAISERISDGDALFSVFPADHAISKTAEFSHTIRTAFEIAESGDKIVTIGVEPSFPSTGFGYIEKGNELSIGSERGKKKKYFEIKSFREKPDFATASEFIKSGKFFWNAGMFILKTSTFFSALESHVPDLFSSFQKIRSATKKSDFLKALKEEYPKLRKISVDFSIMEKIKNGYVVPASFDWDDIGSWNSMERRYPKNDSNIVSLGKTYSLNSENCSIFDACGRITALLGVRDIVVVHTKDATLVCNKRDTEKLKDLVRKLPAKYR